MMMARFLRVPHCWLCCWLSSHFISQCIFLSIHVVFFSHCHTYNQIESALTHILHQLSKIRKPEQKFSYMHAIIII